MRSGSLIYNTSFLFHAAFLALSLTGFLGTLLSRSGRARPTEARDAMLIAVAGAVIQTAIGLAGSLEGHSRGTPGLMAILYRVGWASFGAGIFRLWYLERRRGRAAQTPK